MSNNNLKILYCVSEESYFRSHRLSLARHMKKEGYDVYVAMACTTSCKDIKDFGIHVIPLRSFHRSSVHPWSLYHSFKELTSINKSLTPHLVQHVGLKMSLIGSWASLRSSKAMIVNMLGGLGYVFTIGKSRNYRRTLLKGAVSFLLKQLGRHPNISFIVQNTDDHQWIQKFSSCSFLVPGSGVCLKNFPFTEMPDDEPWEVVCLSRLLKDKGIREFAEAARILKNQWGHRVTFVLYGDIDPLNPSSLTSEEVMSWQHQGILQWRGFCSDVANAYAHSRLVVLPSYREGLPKSLLEAASCGRPIVTTDVPGCRDVVLSNITGLLVPPYDGKSLAQAIHSLLKSPSLCASMGQAGHHRVKELFSENGIHTAMAELYKKLLSKNQLIKK